MSRPSTACSFACLAWLLLSAASAAQDAPAAVPPFVDAVEVRVVNVETFVTDRAGNPVPGLTRGDFELSVDGQRVEITNFYGESGGRREIVERAVERSRPRDTSFIPVSEVAASDRRLYLTIFVDHSRLRASNRKRAFAAIRDLVHQRLRPDDLVTVVSHAGSLVFHGDFLFDRQAIDDILQDVSEISARSENQSLERRQIISELSRGQSGGLMATLARNPDHLLARVRAYAGEQYQQALLSIRQLEHLVATVAGLPGRKALFYVSDGIPNRPGEELFVEWVNRFGSDNPNADPGLRRFDSNASYIRDVGNYDLMRDVELLGTKANEAGVTIYALDAENDHAGELRSAQSEQGAISRTLTVANENLREPLELAASATGGQRIQASGRLEENLARLAGDFDTFYSLGFSPALWDPGARHKIEVRVRRKDLVVRHRQELRVPVPDEQAAQATVTALLYQSVENPLGVTLHPGTETPRDDGTALLTVLVDIPVGKIALLPQGEVHAAELTLFVSVRDRAGNPGSVQKVPFHLQIPNGKVTEALEQSAHYPLPVILRAGDQQVAVGVRDDASAVISTVRVDVGQYSASL